MRRKSELFLVVYTTLLRRPEYEVRAGWPPGQGSAADGDVQVAAVRRSCGAQYTYMIASAEVTRSWFLAENSDEGMRLPSSVAGLQ